MRTKRISFFLIGFATIICMVNSSCSNSPSNVVTGIFEYPDQLTNKGIGPIAEIKLDSLNPTLSGEGKLLFEQKCITCHRFDIKLNGPSLKGVTRRRTPEWMMNMMINPTEMTQKDPIAKDIFEKLMIPMVFQDVNKDQARALLEYLRQMDLKK